MKEFKIFFLTPLNISKIVCIFRNRFNFISHLITTVSIESTKALQRVYEIQLHKKCALYRALSLKRQSNSL